MVQSVIAETVAKRKGLAGQAALAEKIPGPMNSNDRFLSLFGADADFDFTRLNVEDGICRVLLRIHPLVLAILREGPAAFHGGQKRIDFERRLLGYFARQAFSPWSNPSSMMNRDSTPVQTSWIVSLPFEKPRRAATRGVDRRNLEGTCECKPCNDAQTLCRPNLMRVQLRRPCAEFFRSCGRRAGTISKRWRRR